MRKDIIMIKIVVIKFCKGILKGMICGFLVYVIVYIYVVCNIYMYLILDFNLYKKWIMVNLRKGDCVC